VGAGNVGGIGSRETANIGEFLPSSRGAWTALQPRNKKRVDAYNVALSEQVGTDRIPDPVAAWLKSDEPTWPTS
jgi:hypothetical protein